MALFTVAVIPARDEADRLPETLRAVSEVAGVSRAILCDDGSLDATADVARRFGAEVIPAAKPGGPLGKGNALLAGLRRARNLTPDAVLLADADLGESAARLGELLACLSAGHTAAIAAFPPARGGGFGMVKGFARRAISRRTGYEPAEPLSGQRALLFDAVDALPGVAPGFGAEVAMTLDLLEAGIKPVELPLPLAHRPTGRSLSGFLHRARQGRDILRALHGYRLPW